MQRAQADGFCCLRKPAWGGRDRPCAVCVDEKSLLGSYSASVDLQEESARLVLSREVDLERLISHRFPLAGSIEALHLAAHPNPDSMKVVIQPGSEWKGPVE